MLSFSQLHGDHQVTRKISICFFLFATLLSGCSDYSSFDEINVRKGDSPTDAAEKILRARAEIEYEIIQKAGEIFNGKKLTK